MKNKKFFRILTVLCAALIAMGGFSVTAYAGGGEDIPTEDSNVTMQETDPQPLTPEGNMTLVDDVKGKAAEDKQFIVVKSKGGSFFYIIIDHAAQGENSVHFLNQVDEADLLAIIDKDKPQKPEVIPQPKPEPTSKPEPVPPKEEKNGMGGLVIFLVTILLGGGGALYYFKILKPKQVAKGSTDLDEFDFEEYGEDEPEDEADNIDTKQEDEDE